MNKYEVLHNYKTKKINFKPSIFLFKDGLLDKCFFIYPLYFSNPKYFISERKKHELQAERYMEIVALCYYIFSNKKVPLPKLKDRDLKNIDKVCNVKTYSQDFYSHLYYHNLDTFREIEFLSLVFLLSYLLHKREYKTGDYFAVHTEYKNLKNRVLDVLTKLKYDISKFEINELFKREEDVGSVFEYFFGRFESGIPNIFKGAIPKKMNEDTTYKFIKRLNEEMNIKEEVYLFKWETPFKYIKKNKMVLNDIMVRYNHEESHKMCCINLKRNKLILIKPINEELIYNKESLVKKLKECKEIKVKWLVLPTFDSMGVGNEIIYFNNMGLSKEKINVKLSTPPLDYLDATKLKIKKPFIWVVLDTNENVVNYGINKD